MARTAAPAEPKAAKPAKAGKPAKPGKPANAAKPAKPGKAAAPTTVHGPLAPWRFTIAVGAAVLLSAPSLMNLTSADIAALGNGRLDSVVLRGLGFGAIVWFASGVIDRALASAAADDDTDADQPVA